ncbi:winged helix-turn-helix domain-containing protein [Enterobacter roggenkampii]|uniref:winged helix-turn-helix domain-containing protein n=1 Tax=Enterobacter roggenkampii TaxID=1812935 RepID=UPI001C63DDF3|nr:winged helix-turn-helix domain-containing protein [Enterobacter roggenkampii]MBW7678235.1 winged helix-turn-helix domain-containing protein [Enterobacter roggenkampii]WJS53122.1 winged helix-turn-helix domain-containing protein [Enterobacter roggenkampii]HCM9477835.1 winged helix-turn-helix domain-containing protein [Enterobacter roggenkampii]
MVFVIDNRVFYRSEDGAIWPSGDEGSTVILTLTMNRLLTCLLEKHGQVLTRNELLDNVWDAHGLRSSSHTLNKYISELRKHFVQFGITDECITTVPRVGFMFNSDIDVRDITESTIADGRLKEDEESEIIKVVHRTAVAGKKKALHYTLALIVLLISATLVVSGLVISSKDVKEIKQIKPHFLFNYDTCPVYTVQSNSASLSEQKKELFLELANSNHIQCLEGTSFLYQVSESYLYGNKGRAFISRCTQKNNNYISCLNNYWSGYERNQ